MQPFSPFPCPRAIFNDASMSLSEKMDRIRTLQKTLHLLPPDSSELNELIDLCHDVSNKLTSQLLKSGWGVRQN